jgi:hypothetical protein
VTSCALVRDGPVRATPEVEDLLRELRRRTSA